MNLAGRRILQFLAFAVVLRFAMTFVPSLYWWGINEFRYLPMWIAVGLTTAPLAAISWSWNARANKKKSDKKQKMKAAPIRNDLPFAIGFVLLLAILFVAIQIAWPFLGDGSVFGGFMFDFQFSGKLTPQRTATPVMYILYGIYYIYLKIASGSPNVFAPFTILSAISGVIAAMTLVAFARAVSETKKISWLLVALVLGAGGTLFFFGYMETYPLQYASVLVYSFAAYQYLKRRTSILLVALSLLMCITFHLQNILLSPSFVLLFNLRNSEDRTASDKRRFVLAISGGSAVVMLIIYGLSQAGLLGILPHDAESLFIQFTASTRSSYTLFSFVHLLDILNENLLLAAIPIAVIVAILVSGLKKIILAQPYILFLLINLFFFEAFLIGGNFGLGIGRDWDICASLGITIALISYFLFREVLPQDAEQRVAAPIIIASLCAIVSYVSVNTGEAASVRRFGDLLTLYTPSIDKLQTVYGYESLRKYYHKQGTVDDEIRLSRIMIETYPRPIEASDLIARAQGSAKSLSSEAKNNIRGVIEFVGSIADDSLLTREDFDGVRLGSSHKALSITLADQFADGVMTLRHDLDIISDQEAISMADAFISHHPKLASGYELRGTLMLYLTREIVGSVKYFDNALAIDSLRPRTHYFLAEADRALSRNDEARTEYRAMMKLDPAMMLGLDMFAYFLRTRPAEPSDMNDLISIREALVAIINTQASSKFMGSEQEQSQKAEEAKKLLAGVNAEIAAMKK